MLKINIIFLILICSNVFSYESMLKKGYQSCLGCHYTPRGGGLLTDYGKMVSYSEAPFKGRSLKESAFKKAIRVNGKIDHAFHMRLANVNTELSNDTFPMQGDYLSAFRFNKITLLSTIAKAPVRRSQSSIEEPTFIDTVYFRDLKLIKGINNKHFITFGRERQNIGLKIIDHTTYVKNYNKSNITDIVTLLSYDFVAESSEVTGSIFGPNYQEGPNNKEYGGKLELRAKTKKAVLGLSGLFGKTDLINRSMLGLFAKYSPLKYLYLFTEAMLTNRETQQSISFKQRAYLLGLQLSPISSLDIQITTEDIRREEPFYVEQQRLGLGLKQRLLPNLSLQVDYKRSFLGERKENVLISQLFLNVW